MQSVTQGLSVTYEAKPTSVAAARTALAEFARNAGASEEQVDGVRLAASEAVTNAVRHGEGRCTARLWHDGRSVVSEISFETPMRDMLAGRRRPPPDAPSGRGLWLINQVCDLVEMRIGEAGTTLRLHVR